MHFQIGSADNINFMAVNTLQNEHVTAISQDSVFVQDISGHPGCN